MFKRMNVLSQHKYNWYNSIYCVQMIRLKMSSLVKLESKPVLKEIPLWTQDEIKVLNDAVSKHGMQTNRTPDALSTKWEFEQSAGNLQSSTSIVESSKTK